MNSLHDFLNPDNTPQNDSPILARNLKALKVQSPDAAEAIKNASPRSDLAFIESDEDAFSAILGFGPTARALASKRKPLTEAQRLADSLDLEKAGGVLVLGFGLGYHIKALSQRLNHAGVIFVFEPDTQLLHSVLSKIDHTSWLASADVVILTEPDNPSPIANATHGIEGLLAMGVKILPHPPSMPRLGSLTDSFTQHFTRAIASVRTNIVTTLVQSQTTIRNLLMNIDRYAGYEGITDLKDAAKNKPAIVVSAGPGLQNNIHLLKDPSIADRFVIIAVQTVLKTLLRQGIKPHFVTALDHHEISARFYEDISAADAASTTLVVEPKANPAIFAAYKGPIRCPASDILDNLLGDQLSNNKAPITPGATVAHLAYYFARHLGCDPVIFIGQDLGFSDGLYYSQGAAIHTVWAPELNPFNTLEMLEWQRIARNRKNLHKTTDIHNNPIYTDEQMATYLTHFQRDFQLDSQKGLTVIDATESGVKKQHTTIMPLADALSKFSPDTPLNLPQTPTNSSTLSNNKPTAQLKQQLTEQLSSIRKDTWHIQENSKRTEVLLEKLLKHQTDQSKANRLIEKITQVRDQTINRKAAFKLVDFINQAGALNRCKADRAISLDRSLEPFQKQKLQIQRDIKNVHWLGDAATEVNSLLDHTLAFLNDPSTPRYTRDPNQQADTQTIFDHSKTVVAVVAASFQSPAHQASPIDTPFALNHSILSLTIDRLRRSSQLDSIVIITDDEPRVRKTLDSDTLNDPRLHITPVSSTELAPNPLVTSARAFAPHCWRGSLGNLTCHDEALHPRITQSILKETSAHAIVPISAHWCFIDAALIDANITRFRMSPEQTPLCFDQAPPGLSAVVLDEKVIEEIISKADSSGPRASIGGMLSYIPVSPRTDPIAHIACSAIDPAVRNLTLRVIPDTLQSRQALAESLEPLSQDLIRADARVIASRLRSTSNHPQTRHLVLEITNKPNHTPSWITPPATRAIMPATDAIDHIQAFAKEPAPFVVTLGSTAAGQAEPLLHPQLAEIINAAHIAGAAAVHVRTSLDVDQAFIEALNTASPDIISVDLYAGSVDLYSRILTADTFTKVQNSLLNLLSTRHNFTPWIVPRITRCDLALEHIEPFYDHWLMAAGACTIDPLPESIDSMRIKPLTPPDLGLNPMPTTIIHADDSAAHHNQPKADTISAS